MGEPAERRPGHLLQLTVLVGVVAFGTWLRLHGLLGLPLFGDEFHTLILATKPYGEILTLFDKVGSHIPLPLLQHVSQDLLGESLLSFRLPAVVPGILTLFLVYWIARPIVGGRAALGAAALVAVNPMLVYYTRFARAYALLVLLGLVFLGLVALGVRRGSFRGRLGVGVAVVGGLLPYVHLSSLGFVLAVGLTAILLTTEDRRDPRALLRSAAPFLGAAALATLLFAPVIEHVLKYAERVPEEERAQPGGPVEIAEVLAGARWAGWLLWGAFPVGLVLLARRRRSEAWLLGAALAGPLAFLLVTRPHGMGFAWSRYLIVGLPALLIGMAVLVDELCRRIPDPSGRRGPVLSAAAVLLLAGTIHASGPLGPGHPTGEPYTNTYLALKRLPAFDVPWSGWNRFLRILKRDEKVQTVIEAMPLFSRSVQLYRNHALQHRKRVLFGWCGDPLGTVLNGPYVDLTDPEAIRESGADLVILHHAIEQELEDYWDFVYHQAWPQVENRADAGFMQRNETYFLPTSRVRSHPPPMQTRPMAAFLEAQFGKPAHQDEYLTVWLLHR